MTKRVNRPYKKKGRAPKQPPEFPKDRAAVAIQIAALAAAGHRVIGIARVLGISQNVFQRWIDEYPDLQEALAQGREIERMELDSVLRRAANKGNIVAAMFLLKTKHGYREGDQSETANKVSISFVLPGALKPEQFRTIIEHEPTDKTLPVPGKSLTRT